MQLINIAIALASASLVAAGALGLGHGFLRLAAIQSQWSPPTRYVVALIVGIGALGWLAFILGLIGWISRPALLALCLLAATGNMFSARSISLLPAKMPITGWAIALLTLLFCLFLINTLMAFAPPSDTDSLAYHFSLPREYLDAGKVFFTPRAVDGATPLLLHMSYLLALGTGGELAMTLWATLTSWVSAGVLFVLARRHLSLEWSLVTVLLFLTLPAVIYGSGSGQVEVRCASFVLAAFLAVTEARRLDHAGMSALAGLAAGFFAASKYPGLVFVPLVGLAAVAQKRWLAHGLSFASAALIAASPPYIWHWWNTGDPFFPVLYGLVEYRPGVPWNPDINSIFRHWTSVTEKAYPPTLLWAALYPFLATIIPSATIESGRTGLGPIGLLLLPTALAGVWFDRDRILRSPLLIAALLCFGFYLIWFFFGASQRVRHYVPIYPLLLLCFVAATISAIRAIPSLLGPLRIAVAGTLVFQTAINAIFSVNPLLYVLTNETRDEYLRRMVPFYDVARIANAELGPSSRLLHNQRQLNYFFSVPYFLGHVISDARIDYSQKAKNPSILWQQLIDNGITHWAVDPDPSQNSGPAYLAYRLWELGCIRKDLDVSAVTFPTRTASNISSVPVMITIYAVDRALCPLTSR